jgi:hypothetical protein
LAISPVQRLTRFLIVFAEGAHPLARQLRRGFDVRTVQHWMGHKSLETTMRYLVPATDVHDQLDLVTIPSVGKAAPAPRKSAARETRSLRKGGRSHARAEGPAPAGALQPGT